ncbi:hypothetical protein [uncultured Acetobacteroides sp.]|uniref:hypothetical protein n=1 Tax=uncultured Acetobacteroides sp. TaxID=1760811 RepID=UPI0029F45FD0|nr:hypothetical protein [uncultured Acetobacteroides sp.]
MNKFGLALFCAAATTSLFSSHAQAQVKAGSNYGSFSDRSQLLPRNDGTSPSEMVADVEGSQYLSDAWTTSRITMNNGSIIDSIDLRLNVYKNEMHYREKGVEYTIGAPKNIKEIAMGSRKFVSYPLKAEDAISFSYFEVLAEGNTSLLVQYYIKVIDPTYNNPLDYGVKKGQINLCERYFIKTGSTIIEIDKKGKSIFDSLRDKGDLLKKHIKAEDLSFKKKEDLVKIVTYINSMN